MATVANPRLIQLEQELRSHPRVETLLGDQGTLEAAEAAIRFFVWAEHPIRPDMTNAEKNRRTGWLGPRKRDLAGHPQHVPACRGPAFPAAAIELDPTSASFWDQEYGWIGDVFEIRGVDQKWSATGSMGKAPDCHVFAKGQVGNRGLDFPSGHQEWRLVASSAQFLDVPPSNHPLFAQMPSAPPHVAGKTNPELLTPTPDPRPEPGSLIERLIAYLKKHPLWLIGGSIAALIGGLGTLTDGLDKIITFVKKYSANS